MKMFDLKFDINELVQVITQLMRISDKGGESFIIELKDTPFRIRHEERLTFRFSSTSLHWYNPENNDWSSFLSFIRSYDVITDAKKVREHSCLGTIGLSFLSVFPSTSKTENVVYRHDYLADEDEDYSFSIPELYNISEEYESYLFQMSLVSPEQYNAAIYTQMINKIYPVLESGEISLHKEIFTFNSDDLNLITERLKKL